jgi:hypothetical protein
MEITRARLDVVVALSFRPAEPGDRLAILSLFQTAFKADPDPADWSWKYDANPRKAVSVVADDGGRIVGFFGAMGTRYRGAAGDLPGTSAVDVMTDPQARSLGKTALFKELGDAFRRKNAEAGIPFDFGFPHERARKIEERLLGCVTIEPCGEWSRGISSPPLLGRLRRRLLRLREDRLFGTAYAALAERLHARPGWRTDRSADVMAWRLSRPGHSYRVFQLLSPGGRTRGIAVTTVRDGRALVLELQVADEESSDLPDLVGSVLETLRGVPAERLVIRAPREGRLAGRLREELGFAAESSDTVLLVRPFDPSFDLLAAGRAFDYRFFDHDVF